MSAPVPSGYTHRMLPTGLWASLVFLSLPIQVESGEGGPCGPEIEQALASRLAPAASHTRPDRAHVWRQNGLLHIELVNPDGAIIAERTLVERGDCAELAELVAVVVASWESDVHPVFAGPPANTVAAASASTPVPRNTAPASPRSASFDFALGGGPALASSGALTGAASWVWIPRGRGLGLRLSALADRPRNLSLGDGRGSQLAQLARPRQLGPARRLARWPTLGRRPRLREQRVGDVAVFRVDAW
jgi:hypothetical protein